MPPIPGMGTWLGTNGRKCQHTSYSIRINEKSGRGMEIVLRLDGDEEVVPFLWYGSDRLGTLYMSPVICPVYVLKYVSRICLPLELEAIA